jgi:5-deoxy-glucuronate isomerase
MGDTSSWFIPAGSAAQGRADLLITPESAGWTYCGQHVYTLRDGDPASFSLPGEEGVLLSLSARDFVVTVNGERFEMVGRDGVFAGVPDWLYLPVGAEVTIEGICW